MDTFDEEISQIVCETNLSSGITVVIASLDKGLVPKLQSMLDEKELARANRFLQEKDRDQFIFTRGLLKTLLCKYTNSGKIEILYQDNKKPYIENQLFFNVSHSKNLSILAFTSVNEVGVDIETIRELKKLDGMVKNVFSKEEQKIIQKAPQEKKVTAFFEIWSKKEAYLKARGVGFLANAKKSSVSLGNEFAEALSSDTENRWFVKKVPCQKEYAAAVAIKESPQPISIHILR